MPEFSPDPAVTQPRHKPGFRLPRWMKFKLRFDPRKVSMIFWTILFGLAIGYPIYLYAKEHFIINNTSSLPQLVFMRHHSLEGITHGSYVQICPTKEITRQIRAIINPQEMHHGTCPDGQQPMLKLIAAIPGDRIENDGEHFLYVNNRQVLGTIPGEEHLPHFKFRGLIPKDYYFVYTPNPKSFDSRYFGLVHFSEFVDLVHPLF